MPRKPNYRSERFERDRKKAAKKEARVKAKQERASTRQAGEDQETSPAENGDG